MSIDIATETELNTELILDAGTAAALFLEARTANSFTDEQISDETLQAVYALTRMGPTAMNIQPLRITWVRSTEAREALVINMAAGNKEKTLAAPLVALLSYNPRWHENLATTTPHMASKVASFAENSALRQTMAFDNAHLQAGYFILAARSAGLAVGPMSGFDSAGMDQEFNADSGLKSFLVVNLGRSNGRIDRARLPRLDFDAANTTV
ncbi:malonic semialdehyde reductase [Arthrobacter sp. TMP15]|uniref:malonic semialdehyde reductase n=1 Tax=Arthrobacter sp. TMP15 TaxID=3140789 RepID=UPI0031BB215E